jgi:SHS2 domain-containing protein
VAALDGGIDPVSFRLRSHTADIAVEATGGTLAEAFEAVASGLSAAHCDPVPEGTDRFSITAAAESREALLFDYLDELIYQRDVREVLPTDHRVSITVDGELSLEASARGVPLADLDAREIKAVTYSEMALERTSSGWRAYVVFDV